MTLAERLARSLAESAGADTLLVSDHRDIPDALVDAAVLVAVTDRPEPGVILTQRTEHLRTHAGQIAFPGGRVDPGDADLVAAALREADEEIALPPAAVEIAGLGDRYRTGTGYDIAPVIGVVPPDLPLHPNAGEVASVFEVPLAFLLDPGNQREQRAMWEGVERGYYEILWGERRIWGVTAALIVNLSRRLRWR